MKAIILAAGMASRLRPLTLTTPKSLLKVGDRSLLQRSMDALIANGIKEFCIVTGYLHEMIEEFVKKQYAGKIDVTFIYNEVYETTNNIYSLWLARPFAEGQEVLLLDSDLLYDHQIVARVLATDAPNVLTLIRHKLGEEEMKVVVDAQNNIVEISKTCDASQAIGESVGFEKMTADYSAALFKELEQMIEGEGLIDIFYERAFERLIPQGHTFTVVDTTRFFSIELDTVEDFENAKKLIPEKLY